MEPVINDDGTWKKSIDETSVKVKLNEKSVGTLNKKAGTYTVHRIRYFNELPNQRKGYPNAYRKKLSEGKEPDGQFYDKHQGYGMSEQQIQGLGDYIILVIKEHQPEKNLVVERRLDIGAVKKCKIEEDNTHFKGDKQYIIPIGLFQ